MLAGISTALRVRVVDTAAVDTAAAQYSKYHPPHPAGPKPSSTRFRRPRMQVFLTLGSPWTLPATFMGPLRPMALGAAGRYSNSVQTGHHGLFRRCTAWPGFSSAAHRMP